MIQSYPPPTPARNNPNPAPNPDPNPGEVEEPVVKTTEYRSQYAWPRPGSEAAAGTASGAKKSVSMGTIAGKREDTSLAVVGQQRDDSEISARTIVPPAETAKVSGEDEVDRRGGGDTESIMDGQGSIFGDESSQEKKMKFKKTEYKAKYRPFSTYVYVDGNWRKPPKQLVLEKKGDVDPHSWYTEVLERLKKANEYRSRARGSPIYGDQPSEILPPTAELWVPVREQIAPTPLPPATTVQRSPVKEDKLKDRLHTAPVHRPLGSVSHKRDKVQEGKPERPSLRPSAGDSKKQKSDIEKKKVHEGKPDAQSKSAVSAPSRGESKTPKSQARHTGTPPQSRPRAHIDDKTKREDKKPAHPGPVGVHSRASSKASPSPDSSSASGNKPRAVSRPSASSAGTAVVNGEDGKIWLKPAVTDEKGKEKGEEEEKQVPAAEPEKAEKEEAAPKEAPLPPSDSTDGERNVSNEQTAEEVAGEDEIEDKDVGKEKPQEPSKSPVTNGDKKDVVRPNSLPPMNGVDLHDDISNKTSYPSPSPLPEAHTGPVPLTNVKSPEEVTGVKSPDPETWTVPLDTGKGLEWTDGHTPSDSGLAKVSPVIPLSKAVPVNSDFTSSPNDAGSHNHHV